MTPPIRGILLRSAATAVLLLSMATWLGSTVSGAAEATAATLKRDYDSCRVHANIDACYDALRWKPTDPALLVALGDAQMRAQRPVDAIRTYKRAAAIAPGTPGLAAKITAAEARLSVKHVPAKAAQDTSKRYSNAAPEAQSH
jgi:cytochrome c-type biogenesis protein CcmH/NrfG